jgi:hypothetical protein
MDRNGFKLLEFNLKLARMKPFMLRWRGPRMRPDPLHNQRGAILAISLIFVCVLAIAGTMAYRMTANELKIASNFDASRAALNSATAGMEEARSALGLPSTDPPGIEANAIYDPASDTSSPSFPNPLWTAYILTTTPWQFTNDPNYSSADTNYFPNSSSQTNTAITENSLQSSLNYWVKIRHKTDTSSSPVKTFYYGCQSPSTSLTITSFSTSAPTAYRPVEIITAYGMGEKSKSIVQAEVVHDPGPPILAALYAENDVDGDASSPGNAVTISGTDNCTPGACPFCGYTSKSDIYVCPASADPQLDDSNTSPVTALPTIVTGNVNINVNQGIISLKSWKTSSSAPGCYNANYDICAVSSDLSITNQTGTGILLVEGNLTLESFTWNGLILVTGQLILNGGTTGINIQGAVLVNGEVWINPPASAGTKGPITINYNSCAIDAALSSIPLRVLSWEDLSITQ